MSVQPLFTPVRMGDLDLPNRIVVAPLTRMHARSRSRLDNRLRVGTTRLFRLSGYPSSGGRVNSTRGLV
jgi:hypothetical protein